jgi:hypothetical protein
MLVKLNPLAMDLNLGMTLDPSATLSITYYYASAFPAVLPYLSFSLATGFRSAVVRYAPTAFGFAYATYASPAGFQSGKS